ncbi:hypothetical protein [Streptomyces sp. NBC_00887]|nr:hypothetical protein OG844_07250 [Streptomyces sp. NBC_00887]WSY35161.1 hypothetical protein OG844_38350 [Streptomyces sp. NBC_00887]
MSGPGVVGLPAADAGPQHTCPADLVGRVSLRVAVQDHQAGEGSGAE